MSHLYKNILHFLLIFSLSILFMACNSIHAYNNDFGLLPSPEVDELLAQEEKFLSEPTEIDNEPDDPTWTTELTIDPDAVTAEEYIQKPTVYTYKYNFDTKFYEEAEWKTGE